VKDGAGFLMIGGYHSLGPGGYGGTAIEDVLPVNVGSRDIGQITDPFLPVLTPDGRAHPIFANIAKFFPTASGSAPALGGLPPLEGCVKVVGPKPTATVLASYPAASGTPMPVLAVQPAGKGRAAVFTGDTTRNWQQAPRALNQESPFTRFWGQIVRWLANRNEPIKAEAGIAAHTDKAYYEPDSPVTIVAVVRDKQGEGTDQARVTAHVSGPQGAAETVSLSPVPGSGGTYNGTFEPKRPGTFEIVVEAKLAETTLHADKVAVDVGRPNLEFDRLDLDDRRLAAIASATGGKYVHIRTADRLLADLNRQEQKRRVTYETPLYWPRFFWPVFVAVLTTEWVLRKRYQLR
jgi:hypothetical protein